MSRKLLCLVPLGIGVLWDPVPGRARRSRHGAGPREHLHFIVFLEITDTSRISLPVTFRNVPAPQPLEAGNTNEALP